MNSSSKNKFASLFMFYIMVGSVLLPFLGFVQFGTQNAEAVHVADSDTAALWHFDEGVGQYVRDESGNNLNGTLGGTSSAESSDPTWVTGKFGKALKFDGKDDYIECGNDSKFNFGDGSNDNPFTFSAWIKMDKLNWFNGSEIAPIIAKYNSYPNPMRQQYVFAIHFSGLFLNLYDTTNHYRIGIATDNGTIVKNKWHYVVGSYNGNEDVSGLKLFIDGKERKTNILFNHQNYVAMTPTNESLKIGKLIDSVGRNTLFNGTIDEVRISNIVRTPQEISDYYNRSILGAYWRLDDLSGQEISDSSGNKNNGTLGSASGTDNSDPAWTNGIVGNALEFDGVDDYVNVPDSDSLEFNDEITVETWVNINENAKTSSYQNIVSKWGSLSSLNTFNAYDAGNIDGLDTVGYVGGVSDGRYIYFAPYSNGSQKHGRVLRYDTQIEFKNSTNWDAFDAGNVDGLNTVGYAGGVFDGRYIYFVPHFDGSSRHGRVLRYDTSSEFNVSSSWDAFDAGNTDGLDTVGYMGGIFDGRYIYLVPLLNISYHGNILRYDTRGEFKNSNNWQAYNAGNIDGLNTIGYAGAVFDGKFIYFVPHTDASASYHGKVLRYDSNGEFKNSNSWRSFDAGNTDSLSTKGYRGGVFDGRFIYFVPCKTHGRVLRYDTFGPFNNSGSWNAYNAGNTSSMETIGYRGGMFDGKYVYFVPYLNSNSSFFHGKVLRYDTKGFFNNSSSWDAFDAGNTDGLVTKGYIHALSDSRYLYFVPFQNGSNVHGRVLRYDTTDENGSFKLGYTQTTSELSFVLNTDSGPVTIADRDDISSSWHYVVATYDGLKLKLFVDAQLKQEINWTGDIYVNDVNVTIGRLGDGKSYFNGALDEIKIWNRAITFQEINESYSIIIKPDLSITSNDIIFSNPNPYEKEKLTINATVRNIGYSGIVLEDDFESGLGNWNKVYGTPTTSTNHSYSDSTSYLIDEDREAITHDFGKQITGVVEAWFYDLNDSKAQSIVSVRDNVSGKGAFSLGVVTDFSKNYYIYQIGSWWDTVVTNIPRVEGWHKFTFIFNGKESKTFIDGQHVKTTNTFKTFNIVSFGDWWGDGYVMKTYIDDVTVSTFDVNGTVSFYVGNPDDDGILIGKQNITTKGHLPFTTSIEWTAVSGAHDIYVKIDNVNPEDRNYANNIAYKTISVLPYPDFKVSREDIWFSNSKPSPNEEITVYANISNCGKMNGSAVVKFWDRDPGYPDNVTLISKNIISNLEPGKNVTKSALWELSSVPGNYTVFVTIEDALPQDRNLSNNKAKSTNVTVISSAPNAPELSITPSGIYFNNTSPTHNDLVRIYAKIWNNGLVDATSANVTFWNGDPAENGTLIGIVFSQFASGYMTVRFTDWQAVQGTRDIYVWIKDVTPSDANLANNKAYTTIIVNGKPLLTSPLPDVAVDEDNTNNNAFNLNDLFSDSDTLAFTYSGNSNVNVVINPNGSVDISADNDWFGTENITFRATDTYDYYVEDTLKVTVAAKNDAPVISSIPDISFDEDSSDSDLDLDLYVSDVDNTASALTWNYSGNINVIISIDPVTHKVNFTVVSDWTGQELITFTTTDPGSLSDSDTVTVTVNSLNDPPTITNLPDITFDEDTSYNLDLDDYVNDPDNVNSELVWTALNTNKIKVIIDSGTNVATFTADENWYGIESLTFKVTDPDALFDIETIKITVSPVNDRPVVNGPVADFEMVEDTVDTTTIDLDNVFFDVDGDALEYSISGNENITVTINTDGGVTLEPKANWNGEEILIFSATDGKSSPVTDTVKITVTPVNDALVINTEALKGYLENASIFEDIDFILDLDPFISDADDDTLTVLENSIYATVTNLNITLNYPNGILKDVITITVSDGVFDVTVTVTVVVTPVNDAPVLEYIPDIEVNEGETVIIKPKASDVDNDDDDLTFSYSGDMNTWSWSTTFTDSGTYYVNVTVSDGKLTDTQTVKITVNDIPQPPIIDPIPDQDLLEDDPFTLQLDAWDWDNDTLSYSLTLPPSGMTIDSSTGLITWTPLNEHVGVHLITVSVTDGMFTSTSDFKITVIDVNDPPVANVVYYTGVTAYDGETINFTLRIAGTKYMSVSMTLYENDIPMKKNSVTRKPGSPSTQTVSFDTELDMEKEYTIKLEYVADKKGATPVKLFIGYGNNVVTLHHTFNAMHKERDVAEFDINSIMENNPANDKTVKFDASFSYDPDGYITKYHWDFGDGETSTSKVVTHIYSSIDWYNVTLTLTDNESAVTKATFLINPSYKTILVPADGNTDVVDYNVTGNVQIVAVYVSNPSKLNEGTIGIFVDYTIVGEGTLNWVNITIDYSDMVLPDDVEEEDLKLYWWDEVNETWVECENTGVDTDNKIVWANTTHFTIFAPIDMERKAGEKESDEPMLWLIISIILIFFILGIAVTSAVARSENLYVPLASVSGKMTLTQEEKEDPKLTSRIQGIIEGRPGIHYRWIQVTVGLGNGHCAYLLDKMEKEGIIKVKKDGVFKRYYPADMAKVWVDKPVLTDIQQQILEVIEGKPGASQTEISYLLDAKRTTINYHIKKMERNGTIHIERDKSGHTFCYLEKDEEKTKKPKMEGAKEDFSKQPSTKKIINKHDQKKKSKKVKKENSDNKNG